MKNTQILVLFIIGVILVTAGILLKLNDLPLASLLIIVGMTFEAVSGFLIVLKLFKKNKNDSFIDS